MRATQMVDITFRPLEPGDLPLILRWLRDPEVSRWYWDVTELSDEDLAAKWEPRTHEDELVDRFMMLVDGMAIGEIQTNRGADFPDHQAEIGIPDAAGVDLFIGDAKFRHRGLGAEIIQAFIDGVVFEDRQIQTCTIDPHPENTIAIRAYEKTGFRHVKTYYSAAESVDVYLMRLDRDAVSE